MQNITPPNGTSSNPEGESILHLITSFIGEANFHFEPKYYG
jgi:hypothetical protein